MPLQIRPQIRSEQWVWDIGTLEWVQMTQPGGGTGGTAQADNSGFTPGATSFTPVGGEVDDVATTAVTENSAGVTRITPQRAFHVNLRDNSGNEVSVGGGTQYDRDTVAGAADKITMAGVVRSDAGGTLVNADGDRTLLQVDANGAVRVTGGGGGTEYVEDNASPANPTAASLNARRRDTLAAETTTDGDWVTINSTNKGEVYVKHVDAIPVTDNAGSLTVDGSVSISSGTVSITGSVAVTNAGTFAVQDSEKITDNAAFTDGTSKVQPSGYIFDEVAGTALTENDAAAARIDSKRAQVFVLEDTTTRGQRLTITASNAAKVDGSGVTQPVSGTVTANQGGTWNITNVSGTVSLPTGASTLAEQQTQTTSLQLIDDAIYANDAAISKTAAISAQFDDVSPGTTTENNVRALRMSTRRELYGQIRDAAGNERGANVSAGNALLVDASATTQPVSGTITANQGGTWNINNVSGTVSLPTGASTLAEQQTQTTSLQLIDDVVHGNDVALGKVAALGAQFDDTSPGTTTENNIRALRMSTRRELYGQIRDAAGNERGANVTAGNALVVDGSAATQPVSGTVSITANSSVNVAQLAGTTTDTNSGNKSAGTLRVVLATDQPALTNALKVDGSAVTQPVSVAATLVVDGRRAQSILFASISTAASGDSAIVSADGTKKIKVLSYVMVSEGSVNVKWRSATTDKSGAMPLIANTGISATGGTPASWLLETAVNEALNLNLSAAIGVRGHIAYFLEA